MADLTYRLGSEKDHKQLQELRIISYSEFSEKVTAAEKETFIKNLHDEERLSKIIELSKVFVCEHNDRIVGMAYLVPSGNPSNMFPAEWCYIRMVGVDPQYRGNGIAKRLTAQCIENAKATGESINQRCIRQRRWMLPGIFMKDWALRYLRK